METQSDPNYPNILTFVSSAVFQVVFTLLTFCLVIFYNAAYYWYVPVTGVWIDYADPQMSAVIITGLTPGYPGIEAGLKLGDKIVTIDGRSITNLNIPIHQPKQAGEIEQYVVQRGEQTLTIPLKVGSYLEHPGYLAEIVPMQLLSLLVYLLGVVLLFFSAITDIRARLVAVVWALAGVALAAAGPGYTSCAWFAPNVAMLTFAMSLFPSIAAHLYFPVSSFSNKTRNIILWILLGLSALLVTVYCVQQVYFVLNNQIPRFTFVETLINTLFYLSWLVNIGLLIKNRFFVKDQEIRRQIGIIFWGTLIGFLPFLLFYGFPTLIFGRGSLFVLLPSDISVFSLVFVPIAYGYVIHQRRLIKIDFIINRALVLVLLILIILFASLMVLSAFSIFLNTPSQFAIAGSFLCVLVALPSAALKKRIQIQVDRVLYGGYYDYTTVTSDLSTRLAQTMDRPAFIGLLTNELSGKMKIEQSAVLLLIDDNLQMQGNDPFSIPLSDEVCEILANSRIPVRSQNLWNLVSLEATRRWKSFAWAQLFVPIVHQGTLYGLLILGARSSGDIYSNQDLQIVGTVGQQAALSIANIILVEELRGLTRKLVRSDEEQRKKVARDLHDSVLQNLFFIKQRLTRSDPETAPFVDDTITSLRQTIKAQRPSLLDRGLLLALQDLINDIEALTDHDLVILWHNRLEGDIGLSDEKATSIYRIVQEALFNTLKHAQADQAILTVSKEKDILQIQIEDNGIGLANKNPSQTGHQYGMLGMKERATMIGANLDIVSEPGKGTSITVRMKL